MRAAALDSKYNLCITIGLQCGFYVSRKFPCQQQSDPLLLLMQTEEEQTSPDLVVVVLLWKKMSSYNLKMLHVVLMEQCNNFWHVFLRHSPLALRGKDIRRQQGQFRPPYQLCTVPQPTSVLAHTCSLTHTAITLFSEHCGFLATVARTASVQSATPRSVLQVCEGGEAGSGGVKRKDKCRCGYSTRFM